MHLLLLGNEWDIASPREDALDGTLVVRKLVRDLLKDVIFSLFFLGQGDVVVFDLRW